MHARAVILTALMGLGLAPSGSAFAAPSFAPPLGWGAGSEANPQARDRAQAWATAWSAEIRQVMSTRAEDEFAETLAILDVAAPIPAAALTDPEAARRWLEPRVAAALGSTATLEAETIELLPRPEPGVAVLVGRAPQGDRVALVAVAPQGARHLAVVLLVPAAEEILYFNVFDDAVAELDGLRAPVAPFRRGPLRWGALVVWLLGGTLAGVAWTRRSLPQPGARVAGRQVAVVLLVAAGLGLGLAKLWLADAAVELALAGSTPWGFALELALGGGVAAALVLGGTELWDRRRRPVASAPREGSFARTGTAPHRHVAPELAEPITQPIAVALTPAVTGDTQVGPAPAVTGHTQVGPAPAITGHTQIGPAPAVTGHTQVGPAPAVTGDTQVGPAPAVTGHTQVGPAPSSVEDFAAGPPVREIISGNIEVQTQVRRQPEPDTVEAVPPPPPARPEPDTVEAVPPTSPEPDTVKAAPPPTPVLASPPEPARRLPKIEIDWS